MEDLLKDLLILLIGKLDPVPHLAQAVYCLGHDNAGCLGVKADRLLLDLLISVILCLLTLPRHRFLVAIQK